MKKRFVFVVATSTFWLASAGAGKPWDGTYTPYKGQYLIYSNDLDEKQPPTQGDRKMAFMVEGLMAREMFEAMGPDLKNACGASSRLRIREKGDVECTYDTGMLSSPYTCRLGFNLATGKSIPGSTC